MKASVATWIILYEHCKRTCVKAFKLNVSGVCPSSEKNVLEIITIQLGNRSGAKTKFTLKWST